MYDSGKIITGLIIFVGLLTFPIWYNLSKGEKALKKPELIMPSKENQEECCASLDFMRNNHMVLLNDWRDKVVRVGERNYTSGTGAHFNMSLTNTCLNCHSDRAKFCDQCHDYIGISAYCWDCHCEPLPEAGIIQNQENGL